MVNREAEREGLTQSELAELESHLVEAGKFKMAEIRARREQSGQALLRQAYDQERSRIRRGDARALVELKTRYRRRGLDV